MAAEKKSGEVIDLMEALKKSLAERRAKEQKRLELEAEGEEFVHDEVYDDE